MSDRPSSPSEVALAYLDSFDRRDPDQIAAYVSENFVNEQTAALGTSCSGRAAYIERLPTFLDPMPDLHYEAERLIVDGPDVAVFYSLIGTWQGERPFAVRGVQRLRIEDGLIVERTDYWDSAAFLRQVDDDAADVLRTLGLS